jgi:hypothetical protein
MSGYIAAKYPNRYLTLLIDPANVKSIEAAMVVYSGDIG